MVWNPNYEETLYAWVELREECKSLPIKDALHKIHNWWNQAPTVPHYLHFADYMDWPTPWDLLADNTFCDISILLGIYHTIKIIEIPNIISMTLLQTDNYYYLQIKTSDDNYMLGNDIGSIHSEIDDKVLHTLDLTKLQTS